MDQIAKETDNNGNKLAAKVMRMPVIDPSFFDDTHNILDIFIGELYNMYQKECGRYCDLGTDLRDKLKKLQTKFKEAKQAIYFINDRKQEKPIDELEELGRLSDGVRLRSIMCELIDCYLAYKGKRCLIVGIDDLDINIRQAYEMMEQIRKYLLLPNVVILLAAKFDQLRHSICLALTGHYGKLLDRSVSPADISEMAERYLEKFIPTDRRVYMPASEVIMKAELTILGDDTDKFGKEEFASVEFAVLSLIFSKTRYLFYNHDGETSLIVPRNLRELRNLVTLLFRMQRPDHRNPVIHRQNKSQFKQYLHEQWLQALDVKQQQLARIILEESSINKLNKLVVTHLYNLSPNLQVWSSATDDSNGTSGMTDSSRRILKEIVDPANNPVNISVGDLMFLLNMIRKFEDSEESRRLLFFIRAHYSMLLFELYDNMIADNYLGDNGIKPVDKTGPSILVLRNAHNTDEIPQYFNLAGGGFFTLSGNTFIPYSGVPRELAKINGRALSQEIRAIIDEYRKLKQNNAEPDEALKKRMRLVEFFILGSRRSLFTKSLRYSPEEADGWRKDVNTRRFAAFNNAKNILFDATAPFVNMVYPRFAYDRFNKDFYPIAAECDDSLLNRLLNIQRNSDRCRHANLMSKMAIRNIEVLDDMQLWLADKRDTIRPGEWNDIGALSAFYKLFRAEAEGGYAIRTYDKDPDNGTFLSITFLPLAMLGEVLDDVMTSKEELMPKFNVIFNTSDMLIPGETYPASEINKLLSRIQAKESQWLKKSGPSLIGRSPEVTAEKLVQNLTQLPVLDNSTIHEFLDEPLIRLYKSMYLDRSQSLSNEHKDKYNTLKIHLNRLKENHDKLRMDYEDLTRRLKRHNDTMMTLEDEDSRLSATIDATAIELEQKKSKVNDLTANRTRLENELRETHIATQRLEEQLQNIQTRLDETEKNFGTRHITSSELTSELEKYLKSREDIMNERDAIRTSYESSRHRLDEMTAKVNDNETEAQRLRDEIDTASQTDAMARRQRRLIAIQKRRTDMDIKDLTQQQHYLESMIEDSNKDIVTTDAKLNEAKQEYDSIRRMHRSNALRLKNIELA